MISSRRQAHRWLITVLAVLLPWLAVSALMQRPKIPAAAASSAPLFERANLSDGAPQGQPRSSFSWLVQGTRLWGQIEMVSSSAGLQLRLRPSRQLDGADPLLYWSPSQASPVVLQRALLLGSLAGKGPHVYPLPEAVSRALQSQQPGRLLLVSPLDQSVLSDLNLKPLTAEGDPS